MKTIVKQIFHVLVDIILSICWGAMVVLNSVYCATQNENRVGFIVPIVFSGILFIFNIISIFVDVRELNNLCNFYDDKLKQTFLFVEKEVQNGEDKIEAGTLVELPCKVGEVMYEVVDGIPIQEWKIESICFDRAHPTGVIWAERTRDFARWKFWIEDCGTKWFATKSEAEAKLRELKGEIECR